MGTPPKFHNKRLRQTGEGLKLIQEKMASLRPTDPGTLIKFSDDKSAVYEIFGCFRCRKIPNPDYYFICEEKGHRVCSQCLFQKGVDPKDSSEGGGLSLASTSLQQARSSSNNLEACCTPGIGKLLKGPPQLLKGLLDNCKWECKYRNRGCSASVSGSEWADHVKDCRFEEATSRIVACQFYSCSYETICMLDAWKHHQDVHNALVFDGPNVTLDLPLDELIKSHRMLALIKWNEGHYLFAAELFSNTIHMWVWNLQGFDYSDDLDIIYQIELKGVVKDEKLQNNPISCVFLDMCLPYKLPAQHVISDEDCLSIPLDIFKKQYLNTDQSKGTVTSRILIVFRKNNNK